MTSTLRSQQEPLPGRRLRKRRGSQEQIQAFIMTLVSYWRAITRFECAPPHDPKNVCCTSDRAGSGCSRGSCAIALQPNSSDGPQCRLQERQWRGCQQRRSYSIHHHFGEVPISYAGGFDYSSYLMPANPSPRPKPHSSPRRTCATHYLPACAAEPFGSFGNADWATLAPGLQGMRGRAANRIIQRRSCASCDPSDRKWQRPWICLRWVGCPSTAPRVRIGYRHIAAK
jgi:hypothetical protein